MRPQLIAIVAMAVLLALAQGAAGQVNTHTTSGEIFGAWWGAGFWIGITVLLLIAVLVIAFQASKRPNRD